MRAEAIGEKKRHDKFMEAALNAARKSIQRKDGTPFGAVVVRDGEIIAEGRNMTFAEMDPSAHSEVVAIRNACKKLNRLDLSDCVLYTSSEPCPMCMGVIYWAGIREIFYTTNAKEAAAYGFSGMKLKLAAADQFKNYGLKMVSMNKESGIQVFKEWKRSQIQNHMK